ncbi:MAG: TRAP transporter large permease [Pigmentiphaga sp.]
MAPLDIGLMGLVVLVILMGLRMPIGLALNLVSFFGIWAVLSLKSALGAVASLPYEFSAHWSLSAIPMFLLMGAIVFHAGLTSALFTAARYWFGRFPGGLAVATNFASAGFAAASGSSLATATAMARIAVPEMLRHRYAPSLATGVVAASGTLGALIPPSVLFVLYGVFAEESISKLLIAGIFPGLLTAAIYAGMIIVRCRLNPELAPSMDERFSWRQRLASLRPCWPLPLLILAVIVGLYSGLTTATEAGAFGAVAAFVIALFTGRATPQAMWNALVESVRSTASVFFIAVGAILLTRFMMVTGVPTYLAELLAQFGTSALTVLLFAAVVYLVLGMFLDPIGILLLSLPLLLPAFEAFELNGIWLGVIVVKFLEIGMITPPVGLNVYAVKSVMGDTVKLEEIFKGVGWFLVCEAVIMIMLVRWPEISLFLPNLMK